MKLKTIKLHKVDSQGNEVDIIEYKILIESDDYHTIINYLPN